MPDVRIELVGADTYRNLTHGFVKGQPYSVPQELWEEKFSKVRGPTGQPMFSLEGEPVYDHDADLQVAVGLTPNPDAPVPHIQTMQQLLSGVTDEELEALGKTTDDTTSGAGVGDAPVVEATGTSEVPEAPEALGTPEVPDAPDVGGDQSGDEGGAQKPGRRISLGKAPVKV